ncbi:transposase InsO family protein [Streptomyces sp. TLI_171]|nr:transposase InsO family protein [Streptomyces sp. TLI_171]
MSRFQFVHDHRDAYEVKRLCQVLDVNRSSYYKWLGGAGARAVRRREDEVLAERIRRIHADSGGAYGSPRVTAELRESGVRVNHKRVARVMRTYSIVGIRLRRRVRTTVPDPAAQAVPDLFERDFTAPEPGRKYMGDITYLPLAGGEFLYLATVLDCFSRKVVGWSIADHMRTGLVTDALRMAAATRGGLDGAVFHSDHGAQYGSRAFAGLCSELDVTQSMGAVGSSADNAACESFHASLKRETLHGAHDYGDPATCRRPSSPGWSATTPGAGTPPTATSAPTNTNDATTPLNSRSPRDNRPRVHLYGRRPQQDPQETSPATKSDARQIHPQAKQNGSPARLTSRHARSRLDKSQSRLIL